MTETTAPAGATGGKAGKGGERDKRAADGPPGATRTSPTDATAPTDPPSTTSDAGGLSGPAAAPDLVWEYEGYDPAGERLRESLCTLGNGYFGSRGVLPECAADGIHYPGTYVAGCYNRLTSEVSGRHVENEDMVNVPNWLPLRFRLTGGPWLDPDTTTVLDHRLILHLGPGVLERRTRFDVGEGRVLAVRQRRLVHMGDPHLAALRTEFTAEGFSAELEVEALLDGGVTNDGVPRYRDLDGRHLTHVHAGTAAPDRVWLRCRTRTSDIRIGMASRITTHDQPTDAPPAPDSPTDGLPANGTPITDGSTPGASTSGASTPGRHRTAPPDRELPGRSPHRRALLTIRHEPPVARQLVRLALAPGRTVAVDKTVALHTSRDPAISDPLYAAVHRVGRAPGFDALLRTHRTAWERLWRRARLDVPGDAGLILRLHLFHVLQTLSPHTADLDVGVPARGLHGEAYRGHVFWDELFVLPFLDLRFPEVARGLLRYRHRRLERACAAARDLGRRGALYPWQSGSDGREETQQLHLNPRSGRWLPDHTHLQHHVGSAVAYNVWQYCEATGDTEFLHTSGAEMLLRIARFWGDSATWDDTLGRHRILRVMGPDEYHDAYPDATEPGLDDNAYTNVTAAWVLSRTLRLLDDLPAPRRRELAEHVGLDDDEPARWDEISRTLHVPFHEGVVSQFDGYGELAELDWDGYRDRYGDIRRLDRILEAEGDTVNRYRASKQADVLMLGYLFSPGELQGLFHRLGVPLDDDTWRRTVDHYLHRTSHGSTLSGLVHGWVLARARRAEAWTFCQEALRGDIADVQGGTTGEGIHLGAMAGTLDLVQRCLTGMETRDGTLRLDPVPLPQLSSYGFSVRYRGHWDVRLRMEAGHLSIAVPPSDLPPIDLHLPDRTLHLHAGDTTTLALPD